MTAFASWLSSPADQVSAVFVGFPLVFRLLLMPALDEKAYEQEGCR
jgi:hypothetical protein